MVVFESFPLREDLLSGLLMLLVVVVVVVVEASGL
jgi:hypothetical protein